MAVTQLNPDETSARQENCTLAAIVPLYNEQNTVIELLTRLVAQQCISQVIIVDDGSTDQSVSLVEEWLLSLDSSVARTVHLLSHAKNQGKGRAIRTGLERVSTSHVIVQDANLEYDPADIEKLWTVMLSGEADVVYGSRYLQNRSLQKGRWVMQTGVRFLNLLVRVLYGTTLTDEACCYTLFRARDIREMNLESERFGFCSEVTGKAITKQLSIREVPISYKARTTASGKKLQWFDSFDAVGVLIYCRWRSLRRRPSTFRFWKRMWIMLRSLLCSLIALIVGGCGGNIGETPAGSGANCGGCNSIADAGTNCTGPEECPDTTCFQGQMSSGCALSGTGGSMDADDLLNLDLSTYNSNSDLQVLLDPEDDPADFQDLLDSLGITSIADLQALQDAHS